MLYKDPRPRGSSEELTRLDALFVVRHLLRSHITNLFGQIDTRKCACCLVRDADGQPDPQATLQTKTTYNRQLLDRFFNGLVAVDPSTRSRYMRERIVIMKSFWDISTNLRARRLLDILTTVWPDPPR